MLILDYKSKVITPQQAVELVQSNYQIVTGLSAGEGRDFMSHLHLAADNRGVKNVTISNCNSLYKYEFLSDKYVGNFFVDGWFYSASLRKMHMRGMTSFIPNHLHLSGVKRLAHIKPNIYVGSASLPDKHGYISLSCSNTYERRMIDAADISILEINPNFPRTLGDVHIHYSQIDYIIEANYPCPTIPDVPFSEKDMLIGNQIAQYVNDGDCVQLGIGGIPNAVASALKGKKHLGIHTEMLTSGMRELFELGVIDGTRKQTHKEQMVCTFILGDQSLYDFCDNNPGVAVFDGAYVNDPYVISRNDNAVSINTSLEVDLTGQCCSESIGTLQFSGTGGQADTAVGAQMSKNGRSFIALYSTAMVKNPETGEKEEVSKIVPTLKPGAAVSLSRNDVDMIVTEYGIAHLRGTNIRERVRQLINIAHPKFREQLEKEAVELKITDL